MNISSVIAYLLLALLSTCSVVMAEVNACSCAPSRFTFRLDFNRTCDDNSVQIGKTKGIDRSFCRTDDAGIFGDGEDQSPAVVELSSILILELDSSLQVIKQHFRDGLGLMNGQTLQYSSIVADEEGAASTSDENMVAAIQMALTGATADGVEIQSQFILTYTNLCTIDVFQVGDAISWLVVDGITPAPDNLCTEGPLPNLATSGSSSNDIPPDLIDTPADTPIEHISNDNAGMDRSSEPISLSLSMQMLRRLDFSEWLEESPDLMVAVGQNKDASGGLDRRLRRRRFLSG